jgi:hypothetical protein
MGWPRAVKRERRLLTRFRRPIQTRPNSPRNFYVFRINMKSAVTLG